MMGWGLKKREMEKSQSIRFRMRTPQSLYKTIRGKMRAGDGGQLEKNSGGRDGAGR